MTKTVKILIPIITILAILASVLLGVSLFLTPAEAATDTCIGVGTAERVSCPSNNSCLGTYVPEENSEEKAAYFFTNQFFAFNVNEVDKSGIFALTYYITPGVVDNSTIPSGHLGDTSSPSFSFKFCVIGRFIYNTSLAYYKSGDSDLYNGEWFESSDSVTSVTFDTNQKITTAGYYTFYFRMPPMRSNVNVFFISAGYRILYPNFSSNGYGVSQASHYEPTLSVVSTPYNLGVSAGTTAGHEAGYFEGYAAGEVNSENYVNGYNSGNEVGYASGYNVGYTEGLSSASALDGTGLGALGGTISATTNMILKAFDTVGQINVFGITIWSLIGVAVAIAIIFFVVKLIKR
mgnify:CR=1 FL=1